MARISVNKANFYYEMHGNGPPLVLIAGYTCDHLMWAPILPQLSGQFRVLVFDNRGVGQTEDDGRALSIDLMADDVHELIKALGLQKPHVVGHSMGSAIAQSLAARHGSSIDKLVLVSSCVKWRKAMLLGCHSTLSLRKQGVSFDSLFDSILSWVFGETFLQNPKAVALFKELSKNPPYPQSIENQERQFATLQMFDGKDLLEKIKNPTYIIYGKEDLVALPFEAELLARGIKGSTLAACQCAHQPIAEVPNHLLHLLKMFLSAR